MFTATSSMDFQDKKAEETIVFTISLYLYLVHKTHKQTINFLTVKLC